MFGFVLLLQLAAPPTETRFSAPAECPRAADVELRFPDGFSAIRVTIERDTSAPSAYVATAQASHPQRTLFVRTLRSANCAELTEALLLALQIEADAIRKATAPPDDAPSAPPPVTANPPETREPLSSAASLALGLGMSPGILPTVVPDFGLVGQFGLEAPTRILRPHLRLGARLSLSSEVSTGRQSVTFSAVRTFLDVCPIGLGAPRGVSFAPCLRQEVGVVQAQADAASGGAKSADVLISTGVAVHLRVHPNAKASWFVEADAGLLVPWFRDRYVMGTPPIEVHALPAAYPVAMISFGISTD